MVMRILCFGEASNVKKGGELMGVGIVLLDDDVGVVRYRVEISITNAIDSALVVFDAEMSKLMCMWVELIVCRCWRPLELPPFIQKKCGEAYSFQLKLTKFNFSTKHHAFLMAISVHWQKLWQITSHVIREMRGKDFPGDEMPGAKCLSCNCTDGGRSSGTDQRNKSDGNPSD
ncbi:hypothetical protein Bca4012_055164 [Brassica carinata]